MDLTKKPRPKTTISYRVIDPLGKRFPAWFPPDHKHLECVAGPVGFGAPVVVECVTPRDELPKMAARAVNRARGNGYRNVKLEVTKP